MRTALALLALFVTLSLSRAAFADVTITGTVGEIGILKGNNFTNFRFKFTDLNQTKTCTANGNGDTTIGNGYAWFQGGNGQAATNDFPFREWYAALLVSKKGATLSCTIDTNTNCHITNCTLP